MTPSNSETAPEAIVVSGLEKKFGAFTAVAGISFSVHQGEIFGFSRLQRFGKIDDDPDALRDPHPDRRHGNGGRIRHCHRGGGGEARDRLHVPEVLPLRGPDPPGESPLLSRVYSVPEETWEERREWVLDMTRLQEVRNRPTRDLPPGWRQRLALGCALLHKPRILFLDEPTSGSTRSPAPFLGLHRAARPGGITVFVTTHYMDEARHCGRIVMISEGRIFAAESGRRSSGACPEKPDADLNDAFVALMSVRNEGVRHESPECPGNRRQGGVPPDPGLPEPLPGLRVPLLLILLFGYALSLDVEHIETVVVDNERTELSRDFISRLGASRLLPDRRPPPRHRGRDAGARPRPGNAGRDHPDRLDRRSPGREGDDRPDHPGRSDPNFAGSPGPI